MRIGIELISSIHINGKTANYTGGTNYAMKVLKLLIDEKDRREFDIVVFFPVGYENIKSSKLEIDSDKVVKRYARKVTECECEDLDVFFAPQVNGSTLWELPNLKQKYPNLKLYATLHDRQHNFYKYDWDERYYYSGIKSLGIDGYIKYFAKKFVFSLEYERSVETIDKIFTVSNYSMQKLMSHKVKEIKYFVQPCISSDYICKEISRGNYALMVGAGRPEKNLLRTLEAFCKYKRETTSNLQLKVTGVTDKIRKNILRRKGLDLEIIKNSVEFLPYLTYDELGQTYARCRYVVFTSKGEGYGLPVREAMSYGKAVLASRTTSVPEVAGAAICYCDPFDVDSICKGFKRLDNDTVLSRYENYVQKRNTIITEMSKQDERIFLEEILEETE